MSALKSQAIQTALMGDWDTAISINKDLLKEDPNDIDTLNRLAFAFSALGKLKDAKSIYKKVLEIDLNNPIAIRNLKQMLEANKNKSLKNNSFPSSCLHNIFLEEPGKTKVVELTNVAQPKIISRLKAGESLSLLIRRSKIFVLDNQKEYIGMLPEDIGRRLIKFLKGGNIYEAYVKAIKSHKIFIFIRETKRIKRFKNQPSFSITENVKVSFASKKFQERARNSDEDKENNYSEEESDEEL